MVPKMKVDFRLVLVLVLLLLTATIADSTTTAESSYGRNEQHQEGHSCNEGRSSSSSSPPTKTKKLVLFINAANGNTNWENVNSLAGNDWEVQELVLDNFGIMMRDESFTAALENSHHIMKETFERIQPDILLVCSKGMGVIAYLADKKLWANKPVILFSPIPNPIDGMVAGSSYELEWSDTIDVMRNNHLGPILVAAGSSFDEEMLISQAMQEPSACGSISEKTGSFEKCTDWRHVIVPGDHGWKNVRQNEVIISNLIDYMFLWIKKREHVNV